MSIEISTPKYQLAKQLAGWGCRDRIRIWRAAKYLRKFAKLTSNPTDKTTEDEEIDGIIGELTEGK